MTPPCRGFKESEFQTRLIKAQKAMAAADLDALLLTTHPDIYYFTGFLTRFWESPTRPWYLVVPQSGLPVAVIPAIGASLMASTWITNIKTWSAPNFNDDGITLLAETLSSLIGQGRLGIAHSIETYLRMPLADFERLKNMPNAPSIVDDQDIVKNLRMVKSQAEIAKISHACAIAENAFSRVNEIAQVGEPLEKIFRHFQMLCLEEGSDWVAYLAGGAGPHGYKDVISPATSIPLNINDILMLDTGLVWDGYFCDFDRNFALSEPTAAISKTHEQLIEATQAGFEAAKPGKYASDLFHAMDAILTGGKAEDGNGRLGHGLGIQLTEWPSLIPADQTLLAPGMVLSLEPSLTTQNDCMIVHEENIVITDDGARYLSQPARPKICTLEHNT